MTQDEIRKIDELANTPLSVLMGEKKKQTINIDTLIVSPTDMVENEIAVIKQNDTPIMTVNNISCVCGLPKSRKTFTTCILIAAYFSDYCGLSSEGNGICLVIDTEQSKGDCIRVIKRIYRMLHWAYDVTHPELRYVFCREYSPEDRRNILQQAIEIYHPQFVIIDGFSDLLTNTNDLEQSSSLVGWLMMLSSVNHTHICSVLHTNPGSEKARGHAGSELQRKSESVLLITKDGEISNVTPQFCRHQEPSRFSFRIQDGIPVQTDYVPNPKDSNKVMFESIFLQVEGLTYGELKKAIIQQIGCREKTAEGRISRGMKTRMICREDNGIYHLFYEDEPTITIPSNDLPE